MKLRVAMIGCGAVGSIHATHLARQTDVELAAVYSPERESAVTFAHRYGVPILSSVEEAVSQTDLAIICSPSPQHFEQAKTCLNAGRHTLIEMPPCGDVHEAEELGAIARQKGVLIGCAHTARFLEPYARIRAALLSGLLGEIQEISYVRYPQLQPRSWLDDALLHHAAHIIDLVMHWCRGLDPLACISFPYDSPAQSVSLVGSLATGKSLTLAISYGAKLSISRMVVVGANHTVETDGFSFIKSDLEALQFTGDHQEVYKRAIAEQDVDFLEACRGDGIYIPWSETEALLRTVSGFQALNARNRDISRLD